MKRFFTPFLLGLFCVACLLLGSRMLQHGDFYYLSDQARDYTLVRDIVINHKLTLIGSHSGLGGLFHGPLWLYILVPILILGHGNPLFFAYWYGGIPLISLLLGFVVGWKLYGKSFGLLVAFLLSINSILWGYINNPFQIGTSLMVLLYIGFIYFSILYIRGNQKAFIAVCFLAGLAFQFEIASAIALLPIVIFVGLLQPTQLRNLKMLFFSLIAGIVSLSTFILFDLRHHFLIFKSSLGLFSQTQGHKDYATLSERLIDHLNSLKYMYMSPVDSSNIILLLLLLILCIYFIYLVYQKRGIKSGKEIVFFTVSPAVVYILFMAYAHPLYKEYLLALTVSLLFGVSFILKYIYRHTFGKVLFIVFLAANIIFIGNNLYSTYHIPYQQDQSSGSYLNQKQVTNWIWNDANNKSFGYFVYTPETFTYGMDYLFWWESTTRHLPSPQSKKLPITYLILYPTLANDLNGHQFWIKNTIHTQAPIIETKSFTGGIVVDKMDLSKDTNSIDPNYYQNLIFR